MKKESKRIGTRNGGSPEGGMTISEYTPVTSPSTRNDRREKPLNRKEIFGRRKKRVVPPERYQRKRGKDPLKGGNHIVSQYGSRQDHEK